MDSPSTASGGERGEDGPRTASVTLRPSPRAGESSIAGAGHPHAHRRDPRTTPPAQTSPNPKSHSASSLPSSLLLRNTTNNVRHQRRFDFVRTTKPTANNSQFVLKYFLANIPNIVTFVHSKQPDHQILLSHRRIRRFYQPRIFSTQQIPPNLTLGTQPRITEEMAPISMQSSNWSSNYGEDAVHKVNVLASCYLVDSVASLKGLHYCTTGAAGMYTSSLPESQ
jgi:hypothetical protein